MQKFNIGISQSIDLPGKGTLEATCSVAGELDNADTRLLNDQLQSVHDACQKAVKEELARLDS